ncbi:MAG: RNA 2',3'-cyclic phosphodiesterase [Candidatus Pacebacteria bacterium]|jgi:2'-5' RNA ligase|nr:RNA 2',3'-cyclic phosphodiesterase [Candidatus Paceibacterota bacterium]MDD4994428.1 RNA 2',3'-cyclic phosphodiesterase [Candidatus Paceibacterota bacterium]MDD5535164.1 RNA 2',3'-cyclic phosphodiesterase [Candidatus Paceibacterota bacterium]
MKHQHRIFIASHLPDNLKHFLIDYQERKLNDSCFRIVSDQALHLTLIFIGDVFDNDLSKVIQACQSSTDSAFPITVQLDKITYGPSPQFPRLVWVEGKSSQELSNFHENLKRKLIDNGVNFKIENHLFRPHITLARINKECNQGLSLLEIEEKTDKFFKIGAISIIESELTSQGPKYTTLNTFEF